MAARGPGFRQFSATMLEANLDLVIAMLQCLEKFLRMPTLQTSVCVCLCYFGKDSASCQEQLSYQSES